MVFDIKQFPIAKALQEIFSHGYRPGTLKSDLTAGFIVSLIALPLSMALAIAVGLPPEHGLYTAIVAGIAAALLGGSATQVSGPTAAFVVIVAPIVAEHGLRGLVIAEIMAGGLLVLFAFAKLGRLINFVPYPVSTGFTAGIAVVLLTLSMNDLLGLGIDHLQGSYVHKLALITMHLPGLRWPEVCVGVLSLLTMMFSTRILPRIPSPIMGMVVGVAASLLFKHFSGIEIDDIGNRFTYMANGQEGHGVPPLPPVFHLPALPSYAELKTLFPSALVIAALAALESLLSATVADSMSGRRHHPNSELFGIGAANILTGMVSGVPATGAIARTATNIHAGAKSPFAACIHSLFLLSYVLFLTKWIAYIPMASLAALLVMTAVRMSHYKQFFHTLHTAPRSDSIVLLVCCGLTVFIDMVAGVMAGMVLASFLFMRHVAQLMEADVSTSYKSEKAAPEEEVSLPEHVMLYRMSGPLFFGTVEKIFGSYSFLHDHIKTLIIDMEQVPLIDMTGLVAMKSLLSSIAHEGRDVVLCGDGEILAKILRQLPEDRQRYIRICPDTSMALATL